MRVAPVALSRVALEVVTAGAVAGVVNESTAPNEVPLAFDAIAQK